MDVEEHLRIKFETKLASSILRANGMSSVRIIPNHYFTPSLVEIRDMFIDGYFIGAISLSQAVAEGLSRFLCQKKYLSCSKNHLPRVNKLLSERIITSEAKIAFEQIHECRDNFHHMNKNIETERSEIERKAKLNIDSLSLIEKELFGCSYIKGKVIPNKPENWDINTDYTTEVFLDFPNL